MVNEQTKASLIRVAGEMAIAVCERGSLPVTVDRLLSNFEQAYGRLQAVAADQEYHEPKARHVESKA